MHVCVVTDHFTQAALDAIDSGDMNVDFMVTHQFRPGQAKEAFELAAD